LPPIPTSMGQEILNGHQIFSEKPSNIKGWSKRLFRLFYVAYRVKMNFFTKTIDKA